MNYDFLNHCKANKIPEEYLPMLTIFNEKLKFKPSNFITPKQIFKDNMRIIFPDGSEDTDQRILLIHEKEREEIGYFDAVINHNKITKGCLVNKYGWFDFFSEKQEGQEQLLSFSFYDEEALQERKKEGKRNFAECFIEPDLTFSLPVPSTTTISEFVANLCVGKYEEVLKEAIGYKDTRQMEPVSPMTKK